MILKFVEALPFYEAEAKERQKEGGKNFGKGVAKIPQPIKDKGKARDFVA